MKKFVPLSVSLICAVMLCTSSPAIASSRTSLNASSGVLSENSYEYSYSLDDECGSIPDPMEKMNRKIFYFNAFLDHVFLRPFARGYDAVLSDSTKQHVGNFVENIVVTPVTTVNYALQADFGNVLNSFWKFVINSTFGIFGTYDVAGMSGLNPRAQTFGSTLAHYGVPSGKYVVLPILGSTNTRDMLDSFLNSAMNPAKSHLTKKQNLSILVLDKLHQRYKILPFTDYISRTAIDPYTSIKSAYHQSREKEVVYPAGYKCGRQNYKQVLELK